MVRVTLSTVKAIYDFIMGYINIGANNKSNTVNAWIQIFADTPSQATYDNMTGAIANALTDKAVSPRFGILPGEAIIDIEGFCLTVFEAGYNHPIHCSDTPDENMYKNIGVYSHDGTFVISKKYGLSNSSAYITAKLSNQGTGTLQFTDYDTGLKVVEYAVRMNHINEPKSFAVIRANSI